MTRHPSPRLRAYILIGATWLLVGAAFGRPEPIILATPLLVAALAGLLLGKEPEVEVDLSLSRVLVSVAAMMVLLYGLIWEAE